MHGPRHGQPNTAGLTRFHIVLRNRVLFEEIPLRLAARLPPLAVLHRSSATRALCRASADHAAESLSQPEKEKQNPRSSPAAGACEEQAPARHWEGRGLWACDTRLLFIPVVPFFSYAEGKLMTSAGMRHRVESLDLFGCECPSPLDLHLGLPVHEFQG